MYNCEKNIKAGVRSIQNQDMSEIEIMNYLKKIQE